MTDYSSYAIGRNDFEVDPTVQAVESVPVETCSGFGEAWHEETKTNKGVCPVCGSVGMTLRVKRSDDKS